jgi:hypothetical protein
VRLRRRRLMTGKTRERKGSDGELHHHRIRTRNGARKPWSMRISSVRPGRHSRTGPRLVRSNAARRRKRISLARKAIPGGWRSMASSARWRRANASRSRTEWNSPPIRRWASGALLPGRSFDARNFFPALTSRPLERGRSPTRSVAPKQHWGLRRALSGFPRRVGAEESGAA